MDKFAAMEMFRAVVEEDGFTAAAARCRISKSAVSKAVQELEAGLGVALINRTTRRLSATEAGERYLERCRRILEEVEEADAEASALTLTPSGTLRVNAALTFAIHHLAPLIPAFMERYPDLKVELTLGDRFVDMIEEGVDVAVRIGRLPDSSLIARRVAETRRIVAAAPSYLAAHGTPAHPRDLTGHNCLRYSLLQSGAEWTFSDNGKPFTVPVSGGLEANNGDAIRAAAVGGLGICTLPDFIIHADLAAGRLVPLLETYESPPLGIHAVFPANRHLSAKVRAFVDFLGDEYSARTPWQILLKERNNG
ncbi:MAG: LysR family transcriptional regulator [Sphingomonadales bacterium]